MREVTTIGYVARPQQIHEPSDDTEGLAPQLGDIEAKRVMEEVADDCELIAQDFSAKIDSPSKGSPHTPRRACMKRPLVTGADDEDAAFGRRTG